MAKRDKIIKQPLNDTVSTKTIKGSKQQQKAAKQRITVQISVDAIERIKNAVYWTPGLTLTSLAEDAFNKVVDALEEENKKTFPQRKEELKTGRPIK